MVVWKRNVMRRGVRPLLVLFLLAGAACSLLREQTPLTAEERRWISDHHDRITIGVSLYYPPYEMFGADEEYQGLSADYIRLIGEKVGLKLVPMCFPNRQAVLRKVESGAIDVIAALEMTDELQQTLDFTQAYISVPAAIITRKEFTEDLTLEKLDGLRIGVTVSPEFTAYLQERYQGTYTIVPLEGGYIGGLRALAVGDVEALICDMALASHYIANARISNLRIAGVTNYSIDLRIASRKDMPVLGSILRKGLALILPSERKTIEDRWLSLQYRPFWVNRTFWIGLLVVFGVSLGGITLILVWNRSLKRQVAQRTAVLSSINTVLLGSLECHTEREVMRSCLIEAKAMSLSEQAFWGQLAPGGALSVLLSPDEPPGEKGAAGGTLAGLVFKAGELEKLRAGQVTRARLDGPDDARGLHLVAVPLQRHEAEPARVIVVARRRTPYSAAEVSLLAQMLFVFEEALQRKRAEISLRDKERQLRRVQRMEALGTLAGGVAHDFNNILGVIIANGELIELFHLDGNQLLETKTRAILAAAYRGRDLVSQILSFSRKDSEEVSLFSVSPIIKETVKFLTASLPASIRIEHDMGRPEPPVLADPTRVHQVLMNLCTNAAHAMEGEGGTLGIRLYASEVPAAGSPGLEGLAPGHYLVLQVSDTGTGIRPEHLERIFEPFFTTKGLGRGTGLGLAVVEKIVKTWGGTVQVESVLGKGSVFRVFLPAGEDDERAAQGQVRVAEVPTGTGCILFVDDEEELARSYGEFLRSLGYRVHALTDSEEALAVFERDPEAVDLVITDYSMPGMGGDRLARKMLARRPTLPVILCTGYSQSFSDQDAARLGIREYLKKPVSLRDVAVAIRKYLRPGLDAVGPGQAGPGVQ